jgi:hypothetical protein
MATPEPGHLDVSLKDVKGLTEEQFATASVYLTKTIPKSLALARRVLVDGEAQAPVARDGNVSPQQLSVIVANVRKAYLRSSQEAASLGWVTRPVSLPAELWDKVVELEARAARLLSQRSIVAIKALEQQVEDQKLKALAEREQTAQLRKEMRNATLAHARLVELQKAERRSKGAPARAQTQQIVSRQRRVRDEEARSAIDKATAQAVLKSTHAKAKQKAADKTARAASKAKPRQRVK